MKKEIPLVVMGLGALFFFINLVEDLPEKNTWYNLDLTVNQWIPSIQTNFWITIAKIIGVIFDTTTLLIITLAAVIYLWFKDRKRNAIFLTAVMTFDALFLIIAKNIIHRDRPLNRLVLESQYAFPSGHTLTAVIFLGLFGYLLLHHTKNPRHQQWLALFIPPLSLIIGFSRIYLNVHWVTDVLGGYALGIFILSLCFIIFNRLEKLKR
jgi:undecaprenyl-diphosphatase